MATCQANKFCQFAPKFRHTDKFYQTASKCVDKMLPNCQILLIWFKMLSKEDSIQHFILGTQFVD